MDREELINFLKENLSICVDCREKMSSCPGESSYKEIKISLSIDGIVISSDEFYFS